MVLQFGQHGARGYALSSSVLPVVKRPVAKSSCRPERHVPKAAIQPLSNGQLPHMAAKDRASHVTHVQAAASMEMAGPAEEATKVLWYDKKKELWITAESAEELKETIASNATGKPMVVDFYAGWCSSCKTAYPALCKVAGDPQFMQNFIFAKADVQRPGILKYLRSIGVKGIPTIVVFGADGEMLISFGASFRKMNMVKANLVVIAANPGSNFFTDPNGFVIPKPE